MSRRVSSDTHSQESLDLSTHTPLEENALKVRPVIEEQNDYNDFALNNLSVDEHQHFPTDDFRSRSLQIDLQVSTFGELTKEKSPRESPRQRNVSVILSPEMSSDNSSDRSARSEMQQSLNLSDDAQSNDVPGFEELYAPLGIQLESTRGITPVALTCIELSQQYSRRHCSSIEGLDFPPFVAQALHILCRPTDCGKHRAWGSEPLRMMRHAAMSGHCECIVDILLRVDDKAEQKKMLDFHAPTCAGTTALHLSVAPATTCVHFSTTDRARLAVAEVIIKSGADLEARDHIGMTPLHWAVDRNDMAAVRLLIRAGARINSKDDDGRSPLHLAVTAGYESIASNLLDMGADPNAKTPSGWTPLHEAVANARTALCTMLLQAGADPAARDDSGMTPANLAKSMYDDLISAALQTTPLNEARHLVEQRSEILR